MAVDTARGLTYIATWTAPSVVTAVRTSDGTPLASVTLGLGEDHVRVLLFDATRSRIHVATFSAPARLVTLAIGSTDGTADDTAVGATAEAAVRLSRLGAVILSEEASIVSGAPPSSSH